MTEHAQCLYCGTSLWSDAPGVCRECAAVMGRASCDACSRLVPKGTLVTLMVGGCEGGFCERCRGVEEDDDEDDLLVAPETRPEWGRTQNDFRFEDGLPDDGKGDES